MPTSKQETWLGPYVARYHGRLLWTVARLDSDVWGGWKRVAVGGHYYRTLFKRRALQVAALMNVAYRAGEADAEVVPGARAVSRLHGDFGQPPKTSFFGSLHDA